MHFNGHCNISNIKHLRRIGDRFFSFYLYQSFIFRETSYDELLPEKLWQRKRDIEEEKWNDDSISVKYHQNFFRGGINQVLFLECRTSAQDIFTILLNFIIIGKKEKISWNPSAAGVNRR